MYQISCVSRREQITKKIISYDANLLYLYCLDGVIPCGKDTLIVHEKPFNQILKDVLKGKVFGFTQVDLEVSNEFYGKFSKMVLIFVVQGILDCNITKEMKMHKEKNWYKNSQRNRKIL